MSWLTDTMAAANRLLTYYNGNEKTAQNPGGMTGPDGMASNWDPCIRDLGTGIKGVGEALTSMAASESNVATLAQTVAGSVSAAAASVGIATAKAAEAAALVQTAASLVLTKQPTEVAGIAPVLDLILTDAGGLPSGIVTAPAGKNVASRTGPLVYLAAGTVPIDHDPVAGGMLGLRVEEARTNLLVDSSYLHTQTVTVTAQPYTLSFYGYGTVTLSGAATGSLTGNAAYPTRTVMTFTPTAGTLTLTASGPAQYANLEAGSYPTSHIATATAAVTRAADLNTLLLSRIPGWNTSETTLYLEGRTALGNPPNAQVLVQIDDGTQANRVAVLREPTGKLVCVVLAAGTTAVRLDLGVVAPDTSFKLAFTFRSRTWAASLNGAAPVALTTAVGPTAGATTLRLGHGIAADYWNGTIRRVTAFPRILPDATLAAMAA